MKHIFVCAPLSGSIKDNVMRVEMAVQKLIEEYKQRGEELPLFLVPHFALHGISFDENYEIDREYGMQCCLEIIRIADEVVVLGDRMTGGMQREVEEAWMRDRPITRRVDL
jgi:hypothetical protein